MRLEGPSRNDAIPTARVHARGRDRVRVAGADATRWARMRAASMGRVLAVGFRVGVPVALILSLIGAVAYVGPPTSRDYESRRVERQLEDLRRMQQRLRDQMRVMRSIEQQRLWLQSQTFNATMPKLLHPPTSFRVLPATAPAKKK